MVVPSEQRLKVSAALGLPFCQLRGQLSALGLKLQQLCIGSGEAFLGTFEKLGARIQSLPNWRNMGRLFGLLQSFLQRLRATAEGTDRGFERCDSGACCFGDTFWRTSHRGLRRARF